MALVEQIWKDKSKNEVNPLAFSELAQEWAKKIDIEGREFIEKQERNLPKKKKQQIHLKRQQEKLKFSYQEWIKEILSRNWKDSSNKPTQIRKYYDVIFNLNQRAKMEGSDWNAILAQLHRQLALVHYAKGRDLVTESFVAMMDELIKAVSDIEEQGKKDLEVITNFLEAFMAFYKECRPKN